MIIDITKKDSEDINKMSLSELNEMYDITGAGVVINQGKITALDFNSTQAKIKNPIADALYDALKDVYGKLANAESVINNMIDYITENILSVEKTNEDSLNKIKDLLSLFGVSEEQITITIQNLSVVIGPDYNFDDPIEEFDILN